MSLLKALGIDKYTTRFKQWIASKYVAKDNLKTINGESLEGEGNIEISGGGSSVQANWNQNDSTQPDYVKNRTHYYAEKLQYEGEIGVSIDNVATYTLSPYEYIDQDIYGYRVPDKIKFTGGGTSFILDFIKEPIPGYNYEEEIQEAVNKRFTIDENTDIEVRYYYNGNPDYIEGTIIELELIATNPGYQEYVTFVTEDYYVDLKQIDEKYIPDTIARKSDLENTGSSSSNEYIITQFTYSGIIESLNNGDYLEYIGDEEFLNAVRNNKTIFIRYDNTSGKLLCNYTAEINNEVDEQYEHYNFECGLITFRLNYSKVYNNVNIDISSFELKNSGNNVIIPDFAIADIDVAYSDNNQIYTETNFSAAIDLENPASIIILNNKHEYYGYSKVLNVDGYSEEINLYFISYNNYYCVTINTSNSIIHTIKRAPMPAWESKE